MSGFGFIMLLAFLTVGAHPVVERATWQIVRRIL